MVTAFLAAGCDVLGLDANPAVETLSTSQRYCGITLDVTDPESLQRAACAMAEVHHLVCVAGGALAEETSDGHGIVEPEVFDRSVRLNLSGAYYTLHAFMENLGESAAIDRSVTFISSVNAVTGFGLPAYAAAKAGLTGLMHALLVPLGAKGIRVNCVLPGTTPTPRTRAEWAHRVGHFEQMAASVPLGRLGTPEDVATTVTSLALRMTHLHGVELLVDGGQSKAH